MAVVDVVVGDWVVHKQRQWLGQVDGTFFRVKVKLDYFNQGSGVGGGLKAPWNVVEVLFDTSPLPDGRRPELPMELVSYR